MSEDLSGRVIGSCRLQRRLGGSRTADIYLADHTRLKRKVVIKILAPDRPADEVTVKRFYREAEAFAGMAHPNIVQVYDVGEQDGLHYLEMQYLPGRNVQDVLDERQLLSPEDGAGIAVEVLRGLAQAHTHGIVHRDIKPSNILLGDDGSVVLGDSIFARSFEHFQRKPSDITLVGEVVGTPHYMSPEQLEGRPVDWRSDLYLVGVTLYVMVTGRLPFPGKSIVDVGDMMAANAQKPAWEMHQDVPEALSLIIDRLLAYDREERYPDAETVIAHLEGYLADSVEHRAHREL